MNFWRIYTYSGTRPESIFLGFSVCSYVYLLNYKSELAQFGDKIDILMQLRSAIMGRNGRVVLGDF